MTLSQVANLREGVFLGATAMPIPPSRLDPILVADRTATVYEVVGTLLDGEPYNQWTTVVVQQADGGLSAFTLAELNDDAERLGAVLLDAPLEELPLQAAQTVERSQINLNRAERDARRAPGQRLLVLEDGQPLGVVAITSRGARKALVVELYREARTPGSPSCRCLKITMRC
jgi:hypothetical protein